LDARAWPTKQEVCIIPLAYVAGSDKFKDFKKMQEDEKPQALKGLLKCMFTFLHPAYTLSHNSGSISD
jgi:hypothetical protein